MDCKLVSSKLVQYLDEDLPAAIYQQITAHLDHCYHCAEEYRELVRVSDLARQTLRCPVYRDNYASLSRQLRRQPVPADILYFPRRLRVLRTALTGTAVTAAVLLFVMSVGIPAIEAIQALDAVVDAQVTGRGPVADPTLARGHSLVAWSSGIRWAESLAFKPEAPAEQPDQEQPSVEEPMSRTLPATPPSVVLPAICRSGVIVSA
ncbi:MAG: zf-HC2 domain-containing protein [Candidatus Hydrogenedentes bacterium]|nr:zf-HC2 domain-containing protein [Candidatus Hydrogenedentota bacterium]